MLTPLTMVTWLLTLWLFAVLFHRYAELPYLKLSAGWLGGGGGKSGGKSGGQGGAASPTSAAAAGGSTAA
jgi:hypothetical protein